MDEKNLEVTYSKKGDITIVKICWKMDVTTSPMIEKQIVSLIEDGEKKIILDFSGVEYISSSGLRVLLLGAKQSKSAGGKIVLLGVKSHIIEVFNIAGFTPIFTFCNNEEEAVKFLNE